MDGSCALDLGQAESPWAWWAQQLAGHGCCGHGCCGHGWHKHLTAGALRANLPPEERSPPVPSALTVEQFPTIFLSSFGLIVASQHGRYARENEPKSSSSQIKAFLISEGKQAGPHPCSPPSVTDPIHSNHNSLPFFYSWQLLFLH